MLNDGKRRCFSQRTFGAIMAVAHGYYGRFDYSAFSFGFPPEKCVTPAPEREIAPEDAVPEENLHEIFRIHVSERELYMAVAMRSLGLPDVPALRYLDGGDTLVLVTPKGEHELTVSCVMRERCYEGDAPFSTMTIDFTPAENPAGE